MNKENDLRVVKETINALVASTDQSVLYSWGPDGFTCAYVNGMPSLRFHVNGRIHKGFVYIVYNEGSDLYDIYLVANDGRKIIDQENGVYNDSLGAVIDRLVEKGDLSDEEYNNFARNEFNKIFSL